MITRCLQVLSKIKLLLLLRRNPVGFARAIGVEVGSDCRFIGLTKGTFGSEPYLVRIGNHVTLTSGVSFITHDGGVWVLRDKLPNIDVFAPIVIGDNTFIGLGTIIMPGVTIGSNCVIGAGSVVTRNVPSGFVAVGVPARCIKTITEYEAKVLEQAVYIRNLEENEKRNIIKQMFWGSNENQ